MTYPVLAQPISSAQLAAELNEMLVRAGIDPNKATIQFSAALDAEHRRNPRRYAAVTPNGPAFQFAEQTLWLPTAQRRGLLAHEVGHVLTPGGTEADADRAAADVLGIRIGYDPRWPGKGLQTAL